MRTAQETRERHEILQAHGPHDLVPLSVTLVRLGLLFGLLALLGAWWAAAVAATLVMIAVAVATGSVGADDRW